MLAWLDVTTNRAAGISQQEAGLLVPYPEAAAPCIPQEPLEWLITSHRESLAMSRRLLLWALF